MVSGELRVDHNPALPEGCTHNRERLSTIERYRERQLAEINTEAERERERSKERHKAGEIQRYKESERKEGEERESERKSKRVRER